MISRRQFFAGGSIGTLAAISGCLGSSLQLTGSPLSSWEPVENTWPLPWYNPENTSYNPNAESPQTGVESTSSLSIESASGTPLVLSENYIAVSGPSGGVFRREDLSPIWSPSKPVRDAAFAPPESGPEQRLYVATHESTDENQSTTITALTLEENTANVVFETEFPETASMILIATESHVFMGSFAGDGVILNSKGDKKWNLKGLYGAVSDGQVVTETVGPVRRYSAGSGGVVSSDPKEVWKNWGGHSTSHPAITEDTVLVGSSDFAGPDDGYVHAFDIEDGSLRWEPRSFGDYTGTPAIADDICYIVGHNPVSDERDDGHIAAVDITDGSTIWEKTVDWYPINPVVTGNRTLLVFHAAHYESDEDSGLAHLAAYDTQTGDEFWTYKPTAPIRSVCPVGEEIFIGTSKAVEVLE